MAWSAKGVAIADELLQMWIGGDLALFHGLAKMLLDTEGPNLGMVLDRVSIGAHRTGFEICAAHMGDVELDAVTEASG